MVKNLGCVVNKVIFRGCCSRSRVLVNPATCLMHTQLSSKYSGVPEMALYACPGSSPGDCGLDAQVAEAALAALVAVRFSLSCKG